MFKKFLSVLVCAVTAFTVTVSAFARSDGYNAAAATLPRYLKYYYDQMDEDAQNIFLKMRQAISDGERKIKFSRKDADSLSESDWEMVIELLVFHDPMMFNFSGVEDDDKDPYALKLQYCYKRETYEKMVEAYDKRVDKILAKLTDDMSVYKKIKVIHDSVINTAEYDLESPTNGTVYGTLVKKKARCLGYAHTFDYICNKVGIRTVSVIGNGSSSDGDELHIWNKIYYNKQWYNIDLTWDDPVTDLKHNLSYDYFMISDKQMFIDHTEDNYSFKAPAATDDSKSYYKMYKKYADDLSGAKSIIQNGLTAAAKSKGTSVTFQCSSESVLKEVEEYLDGVEDFCAVLKKVKKNTNGDLIDTLYIPDIDEDRYTVTIYIYYKNTDLDYYFNDTSDMDNASLDLFAKYGIKKVA